MGIEQSKNQDPFHYLTHLQQNNLKADPRIQAIHQPDEQLKSQLIQTLAQSYMGDESHIPEGALQWVMRRSEEIEQDNLLQIISGYKLMAAFAINFALKYGLIYVIKDTITQEIQGLMCIFPPTAIEKGELYSPPRIMSSMWDCRHYMPQECKNKKDTDNFRCDAFSTYCSLGIKKHAQMPHWNLLALAVLPQFQGQGIGKAFMRMFTDLCNLDNVHGFLQCTGSENLFKYFENFGFEQQEKFYIQHKKQYEIKCNMQSAYMLRKPQQLDQQYEVHAIVMN